MTPNLKSVVARDNTKFNYNLLLALYTNVYGKFCPIYYFDTYCKYFDFAIQKHLFLYTYV